MPLADLTHKLTLSVAEAALLTGIGRHAIRDAINNGALRAVRPGKRAFRIKREDLDAWLRSLPEVPLARPARVVPIIPRHR
ncbi:MAG: excisionase family DNA-binding protein [Chloroflexi bacterium]|nr:excisionase family DNA-binding protein [Chloroflexota bacterium]